MDTIYGSINKKRAKYKRAIIIIVNIALIILVIINIKNYKEKEVNNNGRIIECKTVDEITDNINIKDKILEDDSRALQNNQLSIELDGEIQSSLIDYTYKLWNEIPEEIQSSFIKDGWLVELTENNISKRYNIEYSVLAVTIPKNKKIVIRATENSLSKSLIHEIGHYIDYKLNFISNTDSFENLYNEHKNILINTNGDYSDAVFNNKEYFAEVFRVYIQDYANYNDTLKNEFSLIDKAIREMGYQ